MDEARKQRGAEIAKQNCIRRTPKGYIVPSQSGQGKYAVVVNGDTATCTCPDFELRAEPCKHVFAVRIVVQRQFDFADGTVTETVSVTKTVQRTYPQNWPAYNRALTNEGDLFPALLRDLCRGIAEPKQERGRPRATLADSVFCATLVLVLVHTLDYIPKRRMLSRGYLCRPRRQAEPAVPSLRGRPVAWWRPRAAARPSRP